MNQRIRVLELIYGFGVERAGGGAGRFGITLGRYLDPEFFEASVCGLWDFGSLDEAARIRRLNDKGTIAFTASRWDEERPYISFWRAFQGIRKTLQNKPMDIVHSHTEFGAMAALMLKATPNPPIIIRTVHNGHPLEWHKRPLRRYLLSYLLYPLMFNTEIGVSQHITDNLNNRWMARRFKRRALRIYNAIDLDRFTNLKVNTSEMKQQLGIPSKSPVVCTVGRLTVEKGYDTFIRAAAKVLTNHPQTRFVIVGDGELERGLKKLAKQLQIKPFVLFTGPRSDVDKILACSDIFVSTSLWEGLSTAILESMVMGLPIIASDIPGNREIISNGINGIIFPPKHVDLLATAISDTLKKPYLQQKLGRQGNVTVQQFSIEAVTKEHQIIYQEVMK